MKYSPKRQREFEQCIVSASDGEDSIHESECNIDRDSATTEDDSDSQDDEYENGEEQSSDMEDEDIVEPDNRR